MPTFQNKEQAPLSAKPGQYILRVIGLDKKLSKGAQTNGCTMYDFRLLVEQVGSRMRDSHIFTEPHTPEKAVEFCQAKTDGFLKSCGVEIAVGEAWDFDEQDAARTAAETGKPCRFINPIGLRGWAEVGMQRKQNPTTGSWEDTPFNEVRFWITNKEKLPRHVEPKISDEDA